MTSANQTPGGYKFAALVASQTMASKPARACLLWAILSLIIPVKFGHTTACRSPAPAFSEAIHLAIKCSAPCSAVLRHFPSIWTTVIHWSMLMSVALRSSRKHPFTFFPAPQAVYLNYSLVLPLIICFTLLPKCIPYGQRETTK